MFKRTIKQLCALMFISAISLSYIIMPRCCPELQNSYAFGYSPAGIAFSPDGSSLAVSLYEMMQIQIYTAHEDGSIDNNVSYTLPNVMAPERIAFSPDGSCLAVAAVSPGTSNSGIVIFTVTKSNGYTILSNPILYAFPDGSFSPRSIAFSPDGSCFAVTNMTSASHLGISIFNVRKSGDLTILANGL